jgi:cytochrome c
LPIFIISRFQMVHRRKIDRRDSKRSQRSKANHSRLRSNPAALWPLIRLTYNSDQSPLSCRTCAACHSDKPDAIGPTLREVYGRRSGSVPDFRYSTAMQRANLTWDEANLREYIKDPQAKVKGNRMPFGGLSNLEDINDIIAYLNTL